MVSVPRDTRTEIVGHNSTEKINHAYAYGGPKMAVNSLEKLMDVPVDHYIAINMDGVKTVVDEIGGVDITSDATFTTKSTTPFHFDKGKQYHMDGKQALAYMRARKRRWCWWRWWPSVTSTTSHHSCCKRSVFNEFSNKIKWYF